MLLAAQTGTPVQLELRTGDEIYREACIGCHGTHGEGQPKAVVGFDPKFANDYMRGGASAVEDVNENNWGKWRHSITKYLQGAQLRAHLRELLA